MESTHWQRAEPVRAHLDVQELPAPGRLHRQSEEQRDERQVERSHRSALQPDLSFILILRCVATPLAVSPKGILSLSPPGIPQPRPRADGQSNPSIYEMRSYWLKPGTLIEWGNLWHKGVQYRPDAKVLGVFSQIGELYNVHHMWAYQNFQQRKQMRTNAWAKPGWSEK